MGRHVAITGVAGNLGTLLCMSLERRRDVDRVVGVDCRDVPVRTPKLEFHALDIRDPELVGAVKGCDVLIHLSFCVEAMRDLRLMYDVNVGGFHNVLDAVNGAGIGRLVHVSSGYVYGAHPDNPDPIPETAPLRPSGSFAYAEHKAECEAVLREWPELPDHEVTILRPAPVLGRNEARGFLSRRLMSRWFFSMRGHRVPLQFLHENDLVRGLAHFGFDAHPGTFNLAASSTVDRDRLLRLTGAREILIPPDVLIGFTDLVWKAGIADSQPGEWDILGERLVLDTAAAEESGWKAHVGSAECVSELVESSNEKVRRRNILRRPLHARAA